MRNKYALEVRERATRMALDRLADYPSTWAACRDLGEKLKGLDPVSWTRCHLGYAASASVVETLAS